jgi:hypothetical protein
VLLFFRETIFPRNESAWTACRPPMMIKVFVHFCAVFVHFVHRNKVGERFRHDFSEEAIFG